MNNDANKSIIPSENKMPDTNNTAPKKARRLRLNDIKLGAQLTEKEVLATWGPPDTYRGSGLVFSVYKLEDGREIHLLFGSSGSEPPKLLTAKVFTDSNDIDGKTIFEADPNELK